MQHSRPHITPNLAEQDFEESGSPCVIRVLSAHHNNSDHCSTSGTISSLGLASGDSQHYLESVPSVSSSHCGVKGTAAFPAAAPNVCLLHLLSQLSVRAISTFLLLVAMFCLAAFFAATSPQRNPANRLFVNAQVSAEDHHHHLLSADKQDQPQRIVHDSGKFHNIRCSYQYTPPDALCLQQATNSSVGCRLSLHRVTQRACAATHKVEPAQQLLSHNGSTVHERDVLRDVPPVQESQQQQEGGGLCPCHLKHAALVRDTLWLR